MRFGLVSKFQINYHAVIKFLIKRFPRRRLILYFIGGKIRLHTSTVKLCPDVSYSYNITQI